MSVKQLSFADGIVRLGGEELPGVLTSLNVDGKVRYDEQKVDGTSGKSKTPMGWEDHTVSISMVLPTDSEGDCYDKLEVLAAYFKQPDAKANPQIYSVVNRHTQSRGIREIVFDRLQTTESESWDYIIANLGFNEHNPPIVKTEAAAAKTPTPGELAEQAAKKGAEAAKPEEDVVITGDLEK